MPSLWRRSQRVAQSWSGSYRFETAFAYLQVFDGLFGHQLFLLVPLHAAHQAGPDHADHALLREVGLFHLLFGEGDNLGGETRRPLLSHSSVFAASASFTNMKTEEVSIMRK